MKTRFLSAMLIAANLMVAASLADDRSSKSVSPFESIVPISFLEGREQDRAVPPMPAPASALPEMLNEPPPPEPELPAWGDTVDPMIAPIVRPPVHYSLVGPPRGFNQNTAGQDYDAIISDPDLVLDLNSQMNQTINVFRPDGMAPIGVFGDHILPAGTAFISYRYLQNSFYQNYVGSHVIGVPTSFPLAPTRMLQDSQVALAEYGVTDDLTMLCYLPFQHNEVNFSTATGSEKQAFTNPGDIKIQGLLSILRGERSQSHVKFGLSVPVGFLERIPAFGSPPDFAIPYPLVTSSGTYDLLFGYTYRKQTEFWTWGAQANAVIRTGKNTLGYEFGDQVELTAWVARRWSERWSTSARLDGQWTGNVRGSNTQLDPTLSPLNQPNAQGGEFLNGLLGVNYLFSRPGHRIRDQRLFLESGIPLYQWLDGPQLGLSWTLNAGWGMAF